MPARATAYRLFKLLIIKDFQASKYLVTSKTRLSRIGSSLQVIERMEREKGFEPTASSLGSWSSNPRLKLHLVMLATRALTINGHASGPIRRQANWGAIGRRETCRPDTRDRDRSPEALPLGGEVASP